jgi:hypothetical protein
VSGIAGGASGATASETDLHCATAQTDGDARSNFAAVCAAALDAGWRIIDEAARGRLDARTEPSVMNEGERVAMRFRAREVLIAGICDPSVGFSLHGRRRCQQHRDLVRRVVQASRRH